ncbi:MAG: hypothetical protein H0X63_11880 [Flavobacteriales bacterium]|nr:hypothetical protein [Flavobacteriales bacterium]
MGNGVFYAQDAGKTSAIAMEFSAPSIAAYQEGSQTKVEDFYHYLSLLTTPNLSPDLKTQLRENILTLFADKKTGITNFTSDSPEKITLLQFLETIEKRGKTTFTVIGMHSSPVSFEEYCVNTYTLQIKTAMATTTKTLHQKIYFHPERKSFGRATKEVWSLKLGEVE